MRYVLSFILFFALLAFCFLTGSSISAQEKKAEESTNPFFVKNDLQYNAPNFSLIKDEHFLPAFEEAMKQQMNEIRLIVDNSEDATFENTIVALEKSGQMLSYVLRIFSNLVSADSNPERLKIDSLMSPKLAAHSDNINLDEKLFSKIKKLYYERTKLNLDDESIRLLELYYERFVRSGAELSEEKK